MKKQLSILTIISVFLIAGCGGDLAKEEASDMAESIKPIEEPIDMTKLTQPNMDELKKAAPDSFQVEFETSKGNFIIEAHRSWSPHGVDRFYYLVKIRFFEQVRFFRVLDNFMAQFGAHGDPEVASIWDVMTFPDDSVRQKNLRGYLTYAKRGVPNSRTTQFFINYGDNIFLDPQGFSPIGRVIQGMAIVDSFYSGYGEGSPQGNGPSQGQLGMEGNSYLKSQFPKLDYIIKAKIK